jgi:uncharacterized protein with HEPN domain
MPKPGDRERLLHILEAIDLITEYVQGMGALDYYQDHRTQDAVERRVEIIGEAATHVSEEIKALYPQLPWKEMIGMRTVISHEYFQIQSRIVWEVATEELPKLRPQIQAIFDEI